MHYNACIENVFESSCSGWWTRIVAVPYFLDRTRSNNQQPLKNKYSIKNTVGPDHPVYVRDTRGYFFFKMAAKRFAKASRLRHIGSMCLIWPSFRQYLGELVRAMQFWGSF